MTLHANLPGLMSRAARRVPRHTTLRLALCAGLTLATAPALAASSFLVVHGIPGRDVAAGLNPLLPVDVQVNGAVCLLKNFTFGDVAGPFDVPAGTYAVSISLANPVAPCSNAPVVSANVTLSDNSFSAIVAQLSTKGAPSAGVYPIDVSPVSTGKQRFVVVHAANAPGVTVRAKSGGKTPQSASFRLAPGKSFTGELGFAPAFSTTLQGPGVTFGPFTLDSAVRGVVFGAAVGSATSGSVTVIEKLIPNVF